MNEKHANHVVPMFGSYHGPDGAVVELRSIEDLLALFQKVAKQMPKVEIYTDRRHPELRAVATRNGGVHMLPRKGVA